MFQTLSLLLFRTNNTCFNNARILSKNRLFDVFCNSELQTVVTIHTTRRIGKEDRKSMMASLPKRDEGVQGEKSLDINSSKIRNAFPDINTPNMLFDGIRYAEIPIVHIRVSKNNTIMQLTDYKGKPIFMRSCGMEGFKNTRKGTNVAAQATGISLGMNALENGFKKVRICVRGLGPGRMASVKGLQMSGLEIISLTDTTPTPHPGTGNRPRKARRV